MTYPIVPPHHCHVSSSEESAVITGRIRKSWYLKLNPFWWFMNDDEQRVEDAPWYQPTWPPFLRVLVWNIRNPLQNFRAYVIGVSDKNYYVRGRAPVMTVQRDDLVPPQYGFQWCKLYSGGYGDLWFPRYFICYAGRFVVWYIGHQPSGFWGVKFNLHWR